MVVCVLAFAACGGDDEKDQASTNTGTTTQTDTGGTGKPQAGGAKQKKDSKQADRSKPKGGGKNGGSGSDGGGAKGTSPGQVETPSAPAQPNLIPKPRATAKKVCSQFLPLIIQRNLKRGKVTKEKVARNYSKGYPASQRDDAYKGCLAGLREID